MDSTALMREIVKILDEKKGIDIKVIKISELTVMADYFIIVSGTSGTHIRSLADEVDEATAKLGISPRGIEGRATGWILLDYNDVVVHVFTPGDREYYSLENRWADAEFVDISDIVTE